MANGLFSTPQDILNKRRADTQQAIQRLQQSGAKSNEGKLAGGLGQIALAYLGQKQAQETEKQLGALGGTLGNFQTEQDAIAAVDRPATGGYSPQVLAQQEAATNRLRDEEIAGSGLDRELQGTAQTQDILKRSGGDSEGLMKAGRAMIASGNFEGGIKALQVAEAMTPKAQKAPEGKLFQIVDSAGNVTGRTFVKQGDSPVLPEGSRLQTIGSGGKGQNIDIDVNSGSQLSAQEQLDLARDTKFAEEVGKQRAKGIATKEAEDIVVGSSAAEQIPSLLRSIDLLKEVETGGVAGLALRAKQTLGIEAANEAELTNALEKGVISQLREVFGAQFTAKEGQWLKDIEANIGKSTVGNRRLLERGLELANLRVENGISAAIEAGDVRSRRQMEKMLGFRISPPVEDVVPETKEGTRAANEAGDVMVFTNGAWVKQ